MEKWQIPHSENKNRWTTKQKNEQYDRRTMEQVSFITKPHI